MADDEVLRRIDHSLARIDEHMERSNQHMERGNRLVEENRAFFRELTLRSERFMREIIEQLRESSALIREHREDYFAESRAQRAALFRLLDRLDNGPGAAGA